MSQDKLDRIEQKLDSVAMSLNETRIDVAKMKIDVAHHINRSDLLEDKVTVHEKSMNEFSGAVKVMKIAFTILCSLIAAAEAVSQIIRHL